MSCHGMPSWLFLFFVFSYRCFCYPLLAIGWIGVGLGASLFFLKFLAEGIFLRKVAVFVKFPGNG